MRNYLEIITTVSTALLSKAGTPEALEKRKALWAEIRSRYPEVYRILRRRPLGILMLLPGWIGQEITILGYDIS